MRSIEILLRGIERIGDTVHPHLSEPLCASKKYFCSDNGYVKYIEKYITES